MTKARVDGAIPSGRLSESRSHDGEAAAPIESAPVTRSSARPGPWLLVVGALVCVALAVVFAWRSSTGSAAAGAGPSNAESSTPAAQESAEAVRVEVAKPEQHGMGRKTTQPGEVHAFEYAELYAKVSGYLGEQNVDIGDHVKRGDLLARIDVPELAEDVKEVAASLERAKSVVVQNEARIKTSEAEAEAAAATVKKMLADIISTKGQVRWRQSEYDRMKGLVKKEAIEKKLEDERLNALTAAQAAEAAAEAAVDNARAQLNAARARIALANADLVHAKADVDVAQAVLDKATVLLAYTRIESPYDGVITARKFHRGAFIRAPNDGGIVPLLTVARIDKMRVVVQVSDDDVPYVTVGDKATIEVSGIPGKVFAGQVSRMADFEDEKSKTMRVEIDLPNDDDLLREGMYGRRTTIELEPPSGALSVPSSSLVGEATGGEGKVYVVRDGKARLVPIVIGQDDGLHMEVVSGLKPTDDVVVRYNGAIGDGTPVHAVAAREATEPESTRSQTH